MGRLGKRVRIGKYAIPILLLLSITVGTVAATLYVVLTWTMTLTVQATPLVSFYKWPSGPRENTFDEGFSIFPEVTTIQDNATYGIYSEASRNTSIHISSLTNPSKMDDVYVKVFNATFSLEIRYTVDDTDWKSFWSGTDAYYTIWMEVTGATGETSGTAGVELEMRVENP